MAGAEFLKQRADEFLKTGQTKLNEGVYFMAAFSFEQAAQLYLKYYLFKKIADFPKTHSLRELLSDVGTAYHTEGIVRAFQDKHTQAIADLEQAYITARYLPAEFTEPQIKNMERFVKELLDFLEKL